MQFRNPASEDSDAKMFNFFANIFNFSVKILNFLVKTFNLKHPFFYSICFLFEKMATMWQQYRHNCPISEKATKWLELGKSQQNGDTCPKIQTSESTVYKMSPHQLVGT